MTMLKIDYEDRVWKLDLDDVTLDEGIAIQDYLGLTVGQWYDDLFDPKSMTWVKSAACAHWVMLGQNGEPQPPIGSYRLPIVRFAEALLTPILAAIAEEKEPEPDPTSAPNGQPGKASASSPASRTRRTRTPKSSPAAPPADG